jgi:rod shape-determining protein MreC
MSKGFKFILIFIVIVSLVLLSVFTPFLNKLGGVLSYCLTPIQIGITIVVNSTGEFFASFGKAAYYAEQNKILLDQIDTMKKENAEAVRIKKENDSLRELLNVNKENYGNNAKTALVIAKDAGNWFNVFTVNKGTNDEVNENCAVINNKGLIGRVANASANSANIVTIIDPNHSVSGMISRTGDLVQVDGNLELMEDGLCKMTIISENADVMIGDTVETSGVGGIYHRGIMIGIVKDFRNNEEGTGQYAVVEPYVDFQRIYEVLIVTKEYEGNK